MSEPGLGLRRRFDAILDAARRLVRAAISSPGFRYRAALLEGCEASSGAPLSVLCAASKQTTGYLSDLLFEQGFRSRELGRLQLRQLSSGRWLKKLGCSLVMIQVEPVARQRLEQDDWFFIPLWVLGIAALPIPDDTMKGKSIREDTRVIRKAGLKGRVTREPQRFDDFYYNMYVPHVTRTHRASAFVNPYDAMKARLAESDLVMIHDGERDIAGMMIVYDEDRPRLWSIGVRDGDRRYLKLGALTALYHFSCQYLAEKGFESVSLGLSRAFLRDGVLRYKRKWDHTIVGTAADRIALKVVAATASGQSFLQNNPFVFEKAGQLQGAVFLSDSEPLTAEKARELEIRYFHHGLSGLCLFPPNADLLRPGLAAGAINRGFRERPMR